MTERPCLLFWQMSSGRLLTSVLGPPELVALAESRDGNGVSANTAVLNRRKPEGALAWSVAPDGPWRPLSELPAGWLPKEKKADVPALPPRA